MSQLLVDRDALINQCIPELIKSLTGFNESEENFVLCHRFAVATLRNHRYLTVNRHEIRRDMDAVAENMNLSCFNRYATELKRLYEEFVNEPICLEHYEHDIQWSVLRFLLSVAHNPIGAIRRRIQRGSPIDFATPLEEVADCTEETNDLVKELKAANIEIAHDADDDSELSEWTESGDDTDDEEATDVTLQGSDNSREPQKQVILHTALKPPAMERGYNDFDGHDSERWLNENIQSNWWSNARYKAETNSDYEGAIFCDYFNEHIVKASYSFLKLEPVSTVSEYCLMREILWMFTNPVDCKFFRIDDDQIWINANVSLSSATQRGLQTFLLSFTEYMTITYRLRNFCRTVSEGASQPIPAPYTFECYAAGVEDYLKRLESLIVDKEKQLVKEDPGKNFTVITLFHDLEPELLLLKNLYDIHRFSVLDWSKFPAHIAVAHLLSGLFRSGKLIGNVSKRNLAFSLLLTALKGYMNLIDIWWTEGRLDDWHEEFLVEKVYAEDMVTMMGYQARLFSKCKKRSFYVSSAISEVIENDPIIQLLLHHSLGAGYTLNILNGLDRIGDLRKIHESEDNLISMGFLEAIVEELEKFRTEEEEIGDAHLMETLSGERGYQESGEVATVSKLENLQNQIREICDDDLLMLAFDTTLRMVSSDSDDPPTPTVTQSTQAFTNAYTLYKKLNSISSIMLPLENVLFNAIKNLMETKRHAANHFVTQIYKDEFHVMNHLKNIRKVLLLEASDLMEYFCSDLFKRIEDGEPWANPYLLTIQLNDILSSRFTDMTSLFTVEIDKQFNSDDATTVLLAIDELRILYNPSDDLSNMINDDTMASYNRVFQFLLKVKWALGTLEMLRLPVAYKKQSPHHVLCMMEFNLKRLEMLKFWMIFSVQSIQSHLMTHVLQSLGLQLDEKLEKADNLNEMILLHQSYISTIYDHCFQQDDSKPLREGIVRLLNLVHILRDDWNNVVLYIEMDAKGEIEDNSVDSDFMSNSQIGFLEETYCKCHQQLEEMFSREVYGKHRLHLTGLADAFSYNVPY